jgi:hypothetical protein
MSEKKAKEERRAIVSQGKVTFYDDRSVAVSGFPDNLEMAMAWIHQAEMAIIRYFMDKPKSNLVLPR